MKYSYEYKRMCVEMYRQGKWPETPEGIQNENFRQMIRGWSRMEKSCGPEVLQHKNQNKVWTAEEKYELVAKVLAGASNKETAFAAGISDGLLYRWVRRYRIEGYEGLAAQRKGRPPKEPQMRKKVLPAELTPSEREEMIRLKAEKHGVVQSMSRKGNCYDNCIMETFFGRLKNEMFYGFEKEYTSFESFSGAIEEYIDYYNNRGIQAKTKWMPPSKFREASMMKT